ncbi:MAG: glycine--tRNA ligase [Chlamydiales bacterium]|nr:glycine--tRNA ligase [Chlamydiales bacterium]
MISKLTQFWASKGCLIHQGYDLEVGAGTFNPATFLRCLGPEPYSAVYVEPSRRPKDGRYGENPNRVQFYHQMQVIIKPSPPDIQDLYLESLETIGLDLSRHDIRFVHDDWENPTIGAWGLGWEVWADGMEVTQFTYFQAVGGIPVKPVSGELTYGLERLALYIQGVDSFFDLKWNDEITYGEIYKRSEWEWSHYNFTEADTAMWLRHFEDFEAEAKRLVRTNLPIPAYDFVMKASHAFNILDARGVISVTERTGFIGRIRLLAKLLAESYVKSREEQAFPLLRQKGEPASLEIASPSTLCDPEERKDFLLEIGSEELPAPFVEIGVQNLESRMRHFLKENELPFEGIEVFGTPRRLGIIVKGLAGGTHSKSIERKGPAVHAAFEVDGTPTKAGGGFFRSLGLNLISRKEVENGEVPQLEVRRIKDQEYLFAKLHASRKSTRALLAEALPELILKAEFPKKMRWGELDIEYARPLRWVLALYGEEVIPFAVAGILSGDRSFGHRQLDPGTFKIDHAAAYLETLRSHMVMASIKERKNSILEQIKKLEVKLKGKVLAQERVMAQVVHLVEWPFVTAASFDSNFLHAPKEVLISEMVEHQKYFPVGDGEGNLISHFLIVCNNKPTDLIRRGNERALSPRLADGVFLYEEDLNTPLDQFNNQLKKMTFQKELGSVWEKVERLRKIAATLHNHLPICDAEDLLRAAELCKSDLASLLVGEFPELQGHAGAIYARKQGESEAVAYAIEEHWMPRGERAPLPQTPCGLLLSLADKIDNLLSSFTVGLKPTSSSDPYALRRQGIGLIKILCEHKLFLPINKVFYQAHSLFPKADKEILNEIEGFLISRLRTILIEEGYDKDEVEAVLAQGLYDCYDLQRKLDALHRFRQNKRDAFLALLEIHTRVKKILFSQNRALAAGWQTTLHSAETRFPEMNPALFLDPSEKALFKTITRVKKELFEKLIDRRDPKGRKYEEAFALVAELQKPVEKLFEAVKIVDNDLLIRKNRLALLQEIWDLCEELIDFGKLQED